VRFVAIGVVADGAAMGLTADGRVYMQGFTAAGAGWRPESMHELPPPGVEVKS
jgi:hypothetical protein